MVEISAAHRAVLERLAPLLDATFYLVGGVGVAAHFSHRTSRDLDLFTTGDPTTLHSALASQPGVTIEERSKDTLHLRVDGIPVSLISYRYPLLEPATQTSGLPVRVAAPADLACMKLSAIAGRGAARDFWDLHAIIERTGRSLDDYLRAFQQKYPVEDIGHVIRSLVYFGDAEAAPLPQGLSPTSWAAIKRDFETWARALSMR